MKKIIALVLLLAMCVLALASCGEDNVLTCGVTIFEDMNEKDENGNWTGFETEFAIEVGKILGMEVEFQEIKWANKYNELKSGAIDCVWNGFTANSAESDGVARKDLVDFSYGYMLNQQCIVVKTENLEKYKTTADLAGKKACVEKGSAGESTAKSITEGEVLGATAQIDTFREVKSGAVDFVVVDIVLAQNICGKGDYTDLAIVDAIELESEIYAIGFKKGSDLTAKVNDAIKQLEENGKLLEIAQKYGFENVLKVTETIE